LGGRGGRGRRGSTSGGGWGGWRGCACVGRTYISSVHPLGVADPSDGGDIIPIPVWRTYDRLFIEMRKNNRGI
jgi:hypothetical protein